MVDLISLDAAPNVVHGDKDLVCLTTSVRQQDLISLDAAPNVVHGDKDLICLAASVRQQDLISLDAAPNVADSDKNHVHVTKASADVLVRAQELAGVSFECS